MMSDCRNVCIERNFPKRSCWSNMKCSTCNKIIPIGEDVVVDGVSLCPCCGSKLYIKVPEHGIVFSAYLVEAIRSGTLTLDNDEE